MGCSKNLVDSERLLRRLEAKGFAVEHDPEKADGEYVVVNTCGFINDAKEESINLILSLGQLKDAGEIGKIVVMGCLSQRYMEELKKEMPEVDIWFGKFDWNKFLEMLPDNNEMRTSDPAEWERTLTTRPGSCFIKISEGCNRFCAFCAIPLITGRHTSRTIEEILEETRDLVSKGVREFNVIAQDLSSYGIDIYGKHALADLIKAMAETPGVEWIRLHYAYPSDFPMDVLDVMNRYDNVCKYIDIALQHCNDKVLANMRRHIDKKQTEKLISEMRNRVKDIKIRTTLMVGFPGEDEAAFEELLEFVKAQKFDRMGAFAYCQEDDTWAAKHLSDDISEDVKQDRLSRLMELQEEISASLQHEMIGRNIKCIVDRIEGETAVCRSQWDSPDVDPEILVVNNGYNPGEFLNVEITKSYPFELEGRVVD